MKASMKKLTPTQQALFEEREALIVKLEEQIETMHKRMGNMVKTMINEVEQRELAKQEVERFMRRCSNARAGLRILIIAEETLTPITSEQAAAGITLNGVDVSDKGRQLQEISDILTAGFKHTNALYPFPSRELEIN